MANTKTAPATVGAVTGAKIRATEAAQTLQSAGTLRSAGEIPRDLPNL